MATIANGHSKQRHGHAVVLPFPTQSHIKAMIKIAKLIHQKGNFHVTFVNTDFNHRRLLKTRASTAAAAVPTFRFETVPDGLPPSNQDATQSVTEICRAIRISFLAPFQDLLAKLNRDPSCPPVTCIVADGVMPFAVDAAAELGVPVVMFWTFAACGLMGFAQYPTLRDMGLAPIQDESEVTEEYLNAAVDWIPGIHGIRLRDLPPFFRTIVPGHPVYNLIIEAVEAAAKASAVGLHTFDALEPKVLEYLSTKFERIFTIGPLEPLLNQISSPDEPYLSSIGSNLWIEEPECLKWLDSKEANSVIYVNFGSIVPLTHEQLIELAWGLARSNQQFLWIIRSDLVLGESAVLPVEFLEETKSRCMIASWCPQEEVLNHPSIGGFLTHCGWNSMIESLTAGVPMITWHFFSDQSINSLYACRDWGVGMEFEGEVTRCKVEKLVREMMEGEKGKEMRKKAMEWKKLTEKSTEPEGSSSKNLEKMVNLLLSKDP